jgi:hypothetical protein
MIGIHAELSRLTWCMCTRVDEGIPCVASDFASIAQIRLAA